LKIHGFCEFCDFVILVSPYGLQINTVCCAIQHLAECSVVIATVVIQTTHIKKIGGCCQTFRQWDFTDELIGGMSFIHSMICVCVAADNNRVRRRRTAFCITASCDTGCQCRRPWCLTAILWLLSACKIENRRCQNHLMMCSFSSRITYSLPVK